MTIKEKAKRFDAQQTVEEFNRLFPVGSNVMVRKIASKEWPYQEVTVESEAFIANDTEPVCFFNEISGYFSVNKKFIKYPKN